MDFTLEKHNKDMKLIDVLFDDNWTGWSYYKIRPFRIKKIKKIIEKINNGRSQEEMEKRSQN